MTEEEKRGYLLPQHAVKKAKKGAVVEVELEEEKYALIHEGRLQDLIDKINENEN